ncbi:hypothetical protein BGW36DRAFT_396303 [Talaromyces proteolyticus]|uniref:Uncharacterized protein n=1 Tax=Talaromyces proteolyticus TaxID=1131652 RepID=A0AAD4Q1H4_9EURO|nr:uncharacterized protein BGW36DRAFT_396303 [Talaromyces proteolyticus]KAH8698548.1 hypothetical protein BGW36DRAFT_396303 [Talaromyces proteolyticus]
MSSPTFHTTADDLRKPESRTARAHGGQVPANSNVSAMKSIISTNTNKAEEVEQVKSNLPLPDQPPVASDWNSADQRTVNVGSGRFESAQSGDSDSALRAPATAESSVRTDGDEYHTLTEPSSKVGRQGKDNLDGLPKDARIPRNSRTTREVN